MTSVKIIKLVNGDDIVCTIPENMLDDKSPLVKIDKPLQIKYVPSYDSAGIKDYVALIKWTSYSDDCIISIPKDKVMTITTASQAMSSSYAKVSRVYEKATMTELNQEVYQQERVKDELNEKLNEIFKDLDGTTKH